MSSTETQVHDSSTRARNDLDRPDFATQLRRIFDLVVYKTYAELKAEAKRTYIGLLWWILEPIVFMAIFYFVFGVLFNRATENFIPFLLTGLVVWHWFQATITQCSNAIVANQPLIQQVVVPKALFPTVIIVTNTIKFAVVFLILLAFLLAYGIRPGLSWLWSLTVLPTFLVLMTGLSFVLAAVVPLVPDVRIIIDNAFRGLFFLSGIFYDISELPPRFAAMLQWNPVASLIQNLRDALFSGEPPDFSLMAAIFVVSVATTLLGLFLMRLNRSTYAKTTA